MDLLNNDFPFSKTALSGYHAMIFGASKGIGAATGAILAGFLFDLTGGYNFGFILCSIFTFCGALLFWVIPQIRYAKV